MKIHEAQRVVLETTATRDKAEALLEALRRARDESNRQMKALGMPDKLREATGRSFYDNAIDSTRRMIDTLSRCVRDAGRDLCNDDASLTEAERRELAELDAEALAPEAPSHEPNYHSRRAAAPVAPTAP